MWITARRKARISRLFVDGPLLASPHPEEPKACLDPYGRPRAPPRRHSCGHDEPLIAQLVAETLAAEGYEVETARNGREALEKITLRSFDLVLCDLRMPELDGVELYRALEKRHPDLLRRIAFVTGTTESPDYSRFLEETAVPVLHKPFNLGDLERFVRQLL